MLLCSLSSGSGGNCTYVEGGGDAVLVDCGLSFRGVKKRLEAAGLSRDRIRAVLVTHEHADHVAGAGQVARMLEVPLYASAGTLRTLDLRPEVRAWPLDGDGLTLGRLTLRPMPTPHDAAEPTAFVFEAQGRKAAVVTDLGHVTRGLVAALSGLDLLLVEFNHDEAMLREGPYPPSLKQRIKGGLGHLSNARAAELLAQVASARLAGAILAHLSETNNTPALAGASADAALARAGCRPQVVIAGQWEPSATLVA